MAGLLVAPWQQAAVADLVVELGEARAGTLRGQLSRALGDPSLAIGYWLPDRARFIDAKGHLLALPDAGSDRSVTVVEREGQPVAVLVHDPRVLEDPGLREAVTAAAQLAVWMPGSTEPSSHAHAAGRTRSWDGLIQNPNG